MNPPQNSSWEDLAIRKQEEALSSAPARRRPAPRAAHQVQAAYLAHELRAPVTSIRLGLEVLAEETSGKLNVNEKQMLTLALRNTERLEGLVDDIMDYSKIAAGKMTILKEPCDARALIDEAVDVMKAAATAKGLKIIKDVNPLLPRCGGEGRRIVQVLINLISNAIRHTPPRGSITIGVAEGRHVHDGTLLFRVKDTGSGIAKDQLEAVFGLFEQAAGATVKKTGGTGLGLTLARAMVELHGGRIWAESWEGCGATFCFTIPIASADMSHPIAVYSEPLQMHGLIADFARRFNAFIAMIV